MTTMIVFDTLQYAEELESSGIPAGQAKAQAKALANVLNESANNVLATKTDLGKIESELKLLRWILAAVSAGVGSLVMKTFLF